MHPEKNISVTDTTTGLEYNFVVNLASGRTELVLVQSPGEDYNSIVSFNLIPDKVQIRFYKTFQQLQSEYFRSTRST